MIKKILCPTDFSEASINGIEYAVKLAQVLNADLTLTNIVQLSLSERVKSFAGIDKGISGNTENSMSILDEFCSDIISSFKIKCDYTVQLSIGSFESKVAEMCNDYDLIIMGTNGANELYSFFNSIHSYNVALKVNKPVLIIPEDCIFGAFKEILLASDYDSGDVLTLQQLNPFIEKFNSHVTVVHVSENDTEVSKQFFHSMTNIVEDELNSTKEISFERLIGSSVLSELENAMDNIEADLFVTSIKKHNPIYRFVHENLVKDMIESSLIPIMVFHTQKVNRKKLLFE